MDGTSHEIQIEERRPECLLMSYAKIQKLVRKTRHRGRNAEFYVIDVLPTAKLPAEFHIGEKSTAKNSNTFRSLLYNDFPQLL
jgi:hypothetical protein